MSQHWTEDTDIERRRRGFSVWRHTFWIMAIVAALITLVKGYDIATTLTFAILAVALRP